MQKYEQILGSLIIGGFVIIVIADTIKSMIWYLLIAAMLVTIYRLLLGPRGG